MHEVNLTEPPQLAPSTYLRFAHAYGRLVSGAARVWAEPGFEQQALGVETIETRLTEIDSRFPNFVDRAALLGPEFGGTVVMNAVEARV
ncbi:MAG: hypothetical protein ABWY71_02645 [Candidatus Saccharimonadales bacterium]